MSDSKSQRNQDQDAFDPNATIAVTSEAIALIARNGEATDPLNPCCDEPQEREAADTSSS